MDKCYYEILETDITATQEEIQKSFRKLVKKWHPDISKEANAENIIKETEIFGKLELKTFKVQKEIRENPALTKKEDIKKLYSSILTYDNKTRYKTNDFKPIIKYSKISKGVGLSNYIIIIQNTPTLFDYAISKKKAKDF